MNIWDFICAECHLAIEGKVYLIAGSKDPLHSKCRTKRSREIVPPKHPDVGKSVRWAKALTGSGLGGAHKTVVGKVLEVLPGGRLRVVLEWQGREHIQTVSPEIVTWLE